VLIDEARSVFQLADYKEAPSRTAPASGDLGARLRAWAARVPSPSVNLSAERCFETMKRALLERSPAPVVLIVGGGIKGKGMSTFSSTPAIRLLNVDPSPCSQAVLFCDGHDLPFADASVDGVIAQAVLEHVADPVRCVEEIHRVLKPEGVVYSEIPFMQQVHQQGYDFTRFSHMGHRRLFRCFTEIESGAVAGPGTSLAWAWRYFLGSFAKSCLGAKVLYWIGRITGMLIEQADYLCRHRPGALDAASCTFFLGTRAERAVPDRDLIAAYRGAQR
jgi:SAM-dependent methyltransferase